MDNSQCAQLIERYRTALNSVSTDPQVMQEITRARGLNPSTASDIDFLREYAWTVFNSGMRMRIIREKWPGLEEAFYGWNCQAITANQPAVRANALQILNHSKKIDAVVSTASIVSKNWTAIQGMLQSGVQAAGSNLYPSQDFMDFVRRLPWMGKTNSRYLAKNLGFDLAKDDRHLRRLATQYGYPEDGDGVQRFCEDVGECVGKRVSVVETILWNACNIGAI